ncbi:MAG TPA: LamG-like jellyroll fold domain-containing protein [Polyangiaceae bacterium]|nr:LamG-like jellyroll fold domain-containing protein [Polyangiaceae bacterium]
MDTNKKSRKELKEYFKANAIPTESQFAALIDAALNQRDDGIAKPADEPLSVEALPDGDRDVLKLYQFGADTPSWVLSLPVDAAGKQSLSVSNAAKSTRLLIDRDTGAVTAGGPINANAGLKVTAGQTLTVDGTLKASGAINADGGITVASGKTLTVNGSLESTGSTSVAAMTASGTITANGGITVASGKALTVNGSLDATGSTTVAALTASGAITATTLTTSGLITTSGGISAPSGTSLPVLSPGSLGLSRASFRLDRSQIQHIALPSIPASTLSGGFTFQAWYYPVTSGVHVNFELGNAASGIWFRFSSSTTSSNAQISAGNGSSSVGVSANFSMSVNTWVHLGVTYDASTTYIKVYKNGVNYGTSTLTAPYALNLATAWGSNLIGKTKNSNNYTFDGLVSEVSLWSGVRSISTSPPQTNAEGLVAYWPGTEDAGQALEKCTNTGHLGNATMANGASFMPAAPLSWEHHRVTMTAATIVQEALRVPTLHGSCSQPSQYDTVGYFKDSMGIVHLGGTLSTTGALVSGNTIFTLPEGYRPKVLKMVMAFTTVDGSGVLNPCSLHIFSDGQVVVGMVATTNSKLFISLDGISFRAEA